MFQSTLQIENHHEITLLYVKITPISSLRKSTRKADGIYGLECNYISLKIEMVSSPGILSDSTVKEAAAKAACPLATAIMVSIALWLYVLWNHLNVLLWNFSSLPICNEHAYPFNHTTSANPWQIMTLQLNIKTIDARMCIGLKLV